MKSYKVVAYTHNMSREEWLNHRAGSIGGSEVAAVLGFSRWKTPLEVWGQKTGQIKDTGEQTEAMRWGSLLEPIIRKEFARRNNLTVSEANCIFAHVDYPFMTCNIDGYVIEDDGTFALLEIKTANAFSVDDWQQGCPPEYYLQVQYYMGILGLPRTYLAVLVGGSDYRQLVINRDDEVISVIIAKVCQFWELVRYKTPPQPMASDNEVLNKLYPISKNESVQLNSKEIFAKYEVAKSALDIAKKEKEELEAQIKLLMGEAETAICDGFKVSWKSSTRTNFDVAKAKSYLSEDQIKKCTIESLVRAFRVTKIKTSNGKK